jgi:hypothetical protein
VLGVAASSATPDAQRAAQPAPRSLSLVGRRTMSSPASTPAFAAPAALPSQRRASGAPPVSSRRPSMSAAANQSAAATAPPASKADDPLLLRAARGEAVDRPPVWMMRQAGRYMKVYQDLAKKHPSFRERSENADLSTEISLQPWRAFKPDGVILFSDILTPLPSMNIRKSAPTDRLDLFHRRAGR